MEDNVVKATQTRKQQDKKHRTHVYQRCQRGSGAFYLKKRNGLRGTVGFSSLHLTAQVELNNTLDVGSIRFTAPPSLYRN